MSKRYYAPIWQYPKDDRFLFINIEVSTFEGETLIMDRSASRQVADSKKILSRGKVLYRINVKPKMNHEKR